MRIALITPPQYVSYTGWSTGRFCLGQIAAVYKDYRKWFIDDPVFHESGVLDTGAYEGHKMAGDKWIDLINHMNPAIVVADEERKASPEVSLAKSLDSAKELKDKTNAKVCVYPQIKRTTTPDDQTLQRETFMMCLEVLLGCEDIDYLAIGPHVTTVLAQRPNADETAEKIRIFQDLCSRFGSKELTKKKWLASGVGDNIYWLQHLPPFIEMVDTASFFWRSVKGHSLLHQRYTSRASRPENFFGAENYPPIAHWDFILYDTLREVLHVASKHDRQKENPYRNIPDSD